MEMLMYVWMENHQKLVVHLRTSLLYTHTLRRDVLHGERQSYFTYTHCTTTTKYSSQYSFIFHTISSEWLVSQPFYPPFSRSLFRFFIQYLFFIRFFILFFCRFCFAMLEQFNSSSLPCRRSSPTYSDMSIYLSIKFYILLLFTGYTTYTTYTHQHT